MLPDLDPFPDVVEVPVVIKVGDDVSTDEILMAGARALPYRSDIARLADFAFVRIDEGYPGRAREAGPHAVVGGRNYGQGSSREHAAIAPRHLGLRLVLARGYARIHWQNLVNFGILPLEFADGSDHDRVSQGDVLRVEDVRRALEAGTEIEVRNVTRGETYRARHRLSARQRDLVAAGGQIPLLRARAAGQ
ncbi:hypothetical protein [Actinomadura madurae]|uniref:hypothetical protein n=1 Tax=Actinomadura madurae TaxID=1993 RepID=UPI0020D23208|nr:hypothetical protein [Actinomadura madurae]MCQ0021510.1 hypothetical protein [Actinomadura madurae]